MIKAIFFDAAGILYTRSGHTEQFALDLLEENGFQRDVSPDQLERQLALKSQANRGLIGHDAYWDAFLEMRGVHNPDQRTSFTKRIVDYSNDVLPVTGAAEALTALKARGLQLGIITDTMYPLEWKMRRLEKAGVAAFIDIVACSTELGVHKPDPAVYSYALRQANLNPGEAIFVGHLGIELDGAHKAGMVTAAIDNDPDANADFFCQSLLELPEIPILNN